ncbi:hypothetical protein [Stenotrophomonas daejeonensis]|uniref:hypothetical protein n=1 Tax=Stenotrophomonas daejeonensis TaxID=659018 RepID=UPI00128F307A|nr:hypothetical protein [Stenotrophomonas daejeonensis]
MEKLLQRVRGGSRRSCNWEQRCHIYPLALTTLSTGHPTREAPRDDAEKRRTPRINALAAQALDTSITWCRMQRSRHRHSLRKM